MTALSDNRNQHQKDRDALQNERDRLQKLEIDAEYTRSKLDKIDRQQQEILNAINMGKGAWWLLLKIGATFAVLMTAFASLAHVLSGYLK